MSKSSKTSSLPPECLQQPYEGRAAYRAFIEFYLPLPRPRSRVEAYWQYQQKTNKNPTKLLKRPTQAGGSWNFWAVGRGANGEVYENSLTWDERAAVYDQMLDEQLETLRQTQRLKEVERELTATEALLSLFDKTLEAAPAFLTSRRVEEADGKVTKVYETVALNVPGLRQLAALHADIMTQRRLALNMAQKVSEIQHGNAGKEPLTIKHTIDDLIKRGLAELDKEDDTDE